MKLQCPECKEWLPSIGRDVARPGDTVQCGLCLHVWIPVPRKPLASLLAPVPAKDESSRVGTPAEIEMAKRYLARSVAAGRTSAPVFEPPLTDWEYQRRRRAARSGTDLRSVNLEPVGRKLVDAFNDFLATKPEPFTSRQLLEKLPEFGFKPTDASRTSVAQLCRQMMIAGVLEIVDGAGGFNDPFIYAPAASPATRHSSLNTFSVPEKDPATRQLASCNGASIPARDSTLSRLTSAATEAPRRGGSGNCTETAPPRKLPLPPSLTSAFSLQPSAFLTTEVPHGAVAGRETLNPVAQTSRSVFCGTSEENRTQGRLQTNHSLTGPAAQNHGRSVPTFLEVPSE